MQLTRSDAEPLDTIWTKRYPAILLSCWVLVPELRRLVDWQVGYNSISFINVLPILALAPLVVLCFGRRRNPIPRQFQVIAILWTIAFAYASIVGWLAANLIGTMYDLCLFMLPLLVGLWLATMDTSLARRVFDRFANASLWLAVIAGTYGIYQFAAPPPWDVNWVLNSGLGSIGLPEPYQLRIFGPMNSPGTFADFLALSILLNLQRIRLRTSWLVLPLLLCGSALALTFVRSAWLELAVGIVAFLCLSPKRFGVAGALTGAALLVVLFATNLSLITGNPASNAQIQTRLATLGDLQNDESASGRENQSIVVLREALGEPLGQGLGSSGTATKLSAAAGTTVIDNGYLARFFEMGVVGFAFFVIALGVAFFLSVSSLTRAYRSGDEGLINQGATSVAVQLALLGAELSGEHHLSLMGIFLWLAIGVTASVKWDGTAERRFVPFGASPARPSSAT